MGGGMAPVQGLFGSYPLLIRLPKVPLLLSDVPLSTLSQWAALFEGCEAIQAKGICRSGFAKGKARGKAGVGGSQEVSRFPASRSRFKGSDQPAVEQTRHT